MRSLGIDVYFEKENIHSIEPAGEMLLTLMAAFAESESMNMSDNIKWGKRRRFEKGLVEAVTISNLLGFRRDKGVVTVIEEEAETVRRIFREYLDCYNMTEIAEGLNRDNTPTRFGGKWDTPQIKSILLNEKYAGDCLLQKWITDNTLAHRSVRNTGQINQYLVEGCYPAIVDKDTWLIAQEMLKHIHDKSDSNREEHPFVGMMYCSECGKQLIIHTTIGMAGKHLRRYRCRSFKDHSAVEVPGMTYVRPHNARYLKNPSPELKKWREKYGSKAVPRQNLCSDTRIEADYPYEAFVKAWNLLVYHKPRFLSDIHNALDSEDILFRYNANVMYRLLESSDRLQKIDVRLFRKTVDHIDVYPSGKLTFVFKAGIKTSA